MWNDIRLAARLLAKDWGFTLAAAAALVIGLCATITIFTIINGVYLRDLPFANPDRVVAIGARLPTAPPDVFGGLSVPDLRDVQGSVTRFDGIGATDEAPMDLGDDEHAPERFVGAYVSANAFELIGARPVLGRGFSAQDDQEGAEPVVILGHRLWERWYAESRDVIGARVRVNGTAATVIGVMPEGFGFPVSSHVWQPLAARGREINESRDARGRTLDAFGRLSPGTTREQATADLGRVLERLAREYPETNADLTPVVRPFRDRNTSGPLQTVFTGLMGSAVFLLVIACANVANLLLARGAARGREIAVRLSLGASRRQIVRQLLAESLLLAVTAGAAGLGLAAVGVRLFRQSVTGTGEPYWIQFPIEGWVFAFVAGVCLATTVVCGLAPALHTSKANLADALGEGGRGTAGAVRTRRWTDAFVVAQLALSLTLLGAAGLMIRNVVSFSAIDAGVDTANLFTARLSLPAQRYPDEDARRSFYRQLDQRLAGMPGMQAGVTSAAPLQGAAPQRVLLEGRNVDPADGSIAYMVSVGPGYLETLGVQPRRGRLFTASDERDASRLVIVNERFVELTFPDGDAVGRTIRLQPAIGQASPGERLTIIGVVPNVRQIGPRQADPRQPDAIAYVPYASAPLPTSVIVVRSSAGVAAVGAALRPVIGTVDPDLPLLGVMPLARAIVEELRLLAVFGSMFALFAAAALSIAGVGLYAVTAYAVTQRTRELGLRIALGARARHVWWIVTRRVAFQAVFGVAIGLAGALAAGQLFEGLLTGVGSRDPVTLVGVPAVMIAVALAASYVPARRAMRLDPAAALRAE